MREVRTKNFYTGATKIALVNKGRKYYTVKPWQGFHISVQTQKVSIQDVHSQEGTKEWENEIMKAFLKKAFGEE